MRLLSFDNGSSGSFSVFIDGRYYFFKTPVRNMRDFNKVKVKNINRFDFKGVKDLLDGIKFFEGDERKYAVVERPMICSYRFNGSICSVRFFESNLVFFELNDIEYRVLDSKEWQRYFFDLKKVKGDELKVRSLELGNELFKEFSSNRMKDRDSLLMLKYSLDNFDKIFNSGGEEV